MSDQPSSDKPTFEEALARLEQIAQALEDGNLGLDESLACYEEGVKHLKTCHKLLDQAERKIELLSGVDADGNPVTRPFDDEELAVEEKAEARSSRRGAKRQRKASADDDSAASDGPPSLF